MEPKKLTRSQTDRWLAGVCGGLAEYFGMDSTVVRLGVVVLTLFTGGGLIIAYIIAAIIMPNPVAALPGAAATPMTTATATEQALTAEQAPVPSNGNPPPA